MPLILSPIIQFFGTLLGRASLIGGLVASYFGWLYIHDLGIWHKAEAVTIEKVKNAGKVANEKGLKARARVADVDDPVKRLRDLGQCRDCE